VPHSGGPGAISPGCVLDDLQQRCAQVTARLERHRMDVPPNELLTVHELRAALVRPAELLLDHRLRGGIDADVP